MFRSFSMVVCLLALAMTTSARTQFGQGPPVGGPPQRQPAAPPPSA
jgi:hypothetical protein